MADENDINKPIMSPVYNGPDASGKVPGMGGVSKKPAQNDYSGPGVPSNKPTNAKEAYIAESITMDPQYRKAVQDHQRRGGGAEGLDALRGMLAEKYSNTWGNLSPDQQGEHAQRFASNGTIEPGQVPSNSRLEAFKARQNEPTANEKISDPAKIAEAKANRDAFVAQKYADAVQGVKDQKMIAGVNPDTNEFVGNTPKAENTGAFNNRVASEYGNQIQDSKKTENAFRNTQTDLAAGGKLTMDRAKTLTGAIGDEQAKQADLQKQSSVMADPNTKIVTGEHGFVVASQGKLGSSGLANLASNPAMQENAKANGPSAVAALNNAKDFAAPLEAPKPTPGSPAGGAAPDTAVADAKKKKPQPEV